MHSSYPGPLRSEPLSLELHNTIYAAGGEPIDGLADEGQAAAWLAAINDRLPLEDAPDGPLPTRQELIDLRGAIRTMLAEPDAEAVAVVNRASAAAPRSPGARLVSGTLRPASDYHGASRAQVVLAAFANDAIALTTGSHRGDLHACGAPGCVLMFLRDHPRRMWCSNACGNRARQARHYRRTHH
jgi:predicted RNA-binding Zn ribbon-like protein